MALAGKTTLVQSTKGEDDDLRADYMTILEEVSSWNSAVIHNGTKQPEEEEEKGEGSKVADRADHLNGCLPAKR